MKTFWMRCGCGAEWVEVGPGTTEIRNYRAYLACDHEGLYAAQSRLVWRSFGARVVKRREEAFMSFIEACA